jgi:hypothetical protein
MLFTLEYLILKLYPIGCNCGRLPRIVEILGNLRIDYIRRDNLVKISNLGKV